MTDCPSPPSVPDSLLAIQTQINRLNEENERLQTIVEKACHDLDKLSHEIPEKLLPSTRSIILRLLQGLHSKPTFPWLYRKGVMRTALRRILESPFVPFKRSPIVVPQDEGIAAQYLMIIMSFLNAYSTPSSRNQSTKGLTLRHSHCLFNSSWFCQWNWSPLRPPLHLHHPIRSHLFTLFPVCFWSTSSTLSLYHCFILEALPDEEGLLQVSNESCFYYRNLTALT
jgi:hypothetical protein